MFGPPPVQTHDTEKSVKEQRQLRLMSACNAPLGTCGPWWRPSTEVSTAGPQRGSCDLALSAQSQARPCGATQREGKEGSGGLVLRWSCVAEPCSALPPLPVELRNAHLKLHPKVPEAAAPGSGSQTYNTG